MNFKGRAKRLEDIDLPRIAATIGCGEDHLHAFMEVEAAGSGFDEQGRPKMLFEPHVFYRLLGKGKARDKAVAAGVAYAKWKPRGYPKDSYPRLAKAMEINATLALMSASWGALQIMGLNHGAAGYVSPEEMVREFMDDEDNHVEAAIRFIVNKKLDDDLRAKRWDVIEKVYNGGGYGGAYARKMAKAYAKWAKIKDTPLPAAIEPRDLAEDAPGPAEVPGVPVAEEKPSSPPPRPAAGPSVGQVATTVGTGAAGVTLLGVPWQYVALGAALIIGAVIAVQIIRNRQRSS